MQNFSGTVHLETNWGGLEVQQEGVKGCSSSLCSAEGSLDNLDLPLNRAIQLGVVREGCYMFSAMLLQVLGEFFK